MVLVNSELPESSQNAADSKLSYSLADGNIRSKSFLIGAFMGICLYSTSSKQTTKMINITSLNNGYSHCSSNSVIRSSIINSEDTTSPQGIHGIQITQEEAKLLAFS